jgi:ribonuclease HI
MPPIAHLPPIHLSLPDKIIIVTNASVHQDKSAYAWVVAKSNGDIIWQQKKRISESNISSFRAKAMGVLSVLKALHENIKQQNTKWELYCDNQAVIKRMVRINDHVPNIEWTDSNVLLEIKRYLPPGGTFHHVKGHKTPSKDDTIAETLNILVDKKANEAIHYTSSSTPIEYIIQIRGNNTPLYNIQQLVAHCQIRISETYLHRKLATTYPMIDCIQFKIIVKEFRKYMSIIKMLSGITPTRKHCFKLKQVASPECQLCSKHDEDISHILFCSKNGNNICCHMQTLKKQLKKYGNITTVTKKIINNIQDHNSVNDSEISRDQQIIGWDKILQGKIAIHFGDQFESLMKKKEDTTKNISDLIKFLIYQWKKAWMFRLQFIHQQKHKQVHEEKIQQNNQRLQRLYDNKSLLTRKMQMLMFSNVQEHKNQTTTQIDSWLQLHFKSLDKHITFQTKQQEQAQRQGKDPRIPCEAGTGTPIKLQLGLNTI